MLIVMSQPALNSGGRASFVLTFKPHRETLHVVVIIFSPNGQCDELRFSLYAFSSLRPNETNETHCCREIMYKRHQYLLGTQEGRIQDLRIYEARPLRFQVPGNSEVTDPFDRQINADHLDCSPGPSSTVARG